MTDTLSSINVEKLTSSVNNAVGGGTFEMPQPETSSSTQPLEVNSTSSLQPTIPVLPKGIYSLTPTVTPRMATMNQLFQLSKALSINVGQTSPVAAGTQGSIESGSVLEAAIAAGSYVPRTQYSSATPVSTDSVAQQQSYPATQCLSNVQTQPCLVKQQETFTEIRNDSLTSEFQSKVSELCPSGNVPVSESSAVNMNDTLTSVPGFGMMNKSTGAYSFPLTYFHPLSPASHGAVSYSLPSTVFEQPTATQSLSQTLTTTTVTLASNQTSSSSSSSTTQAQNTTQPSTAPLCISPISPANSPVLSSQPGLHNINISSLPFMLSWQVADRQSESSDKTTSRTVSPADLNRLTPFTTHFPISLPVLTASDRQLIQQLPLSGEELSTPTESNGAFGQENQLMVNPPRQENCLPEGHQQTDSHSELYSHSANEVNASSNIDQSEVAKTGIGMALSLLSQSNQQDHQTSNCQPSVTMAMNLLAQAAQSESQSQSVVCQPNVTLAMSLLNQVSSNAGVMSHDECDAEQGRVSSLASLSSSLAGQDGFPAVPANMAHLFQFGGQCGPSASQPQMLPTITFSPDAEGQNVPARVYMTSPIAMVPMSHDHQDKNHHDSLTSPSPAALALANMSVIDMLLKNHGNELQAAEKSTDALPASLNKTPAICGQYCVECNSTYKEPCKFHITDYMHLTDTPLLTRARATLPLTLGLQKSSLNGHFSDVGVFCNKTVKLRTLLGPLVGKPVPSEMWESGKKFVFWKIFYEDSFTVLDISDEDVSNWLMFVKPARNALEQNLVAFQKDEEIYFVTCKDIEPGQELLFWYAKDYAKLLGLSPKPRRNGTSYCPYCCVCEKVFPDRKSLKQHKKAEHPNLTERKWACQFCAHRFTSSAKLNTHVIALHLHFKPFFCRHCGKQFADQSNLRHHTKIHTGEKKFVCDTCEKSFRQKAHLTTHKLVHTGVKALQCQFCAVRFARRSDLKQHEYQHTKEKVYPCSECMKVFYKLQNYNKHVKIHNNERNYHCQHCPKTFVTSYHLKRHLKACKGLKTAAMKMTAEADDVLFDDFNDNADDDEDGIARIIADVAPSEGSGVFESDSRHSQGNVTNLGLEET